MIIFEKGISVRLKDNKTSTIRVNSGCELGDIGWSAEMLVQEVLLQSRKHMHINQRLSYLYNGLPESMVKIPDMNIYRTDMVQNDYQEVQFSTTAINGIIRRNAFGNNGFDSELESTSLYSLISFINSCTNPENANAICMIPTPGAAQHLKMIIALRHICAGEEIIIDYTHGKTAKERENVMKCFDIKLESEI